MKFVTHKLFLCIFVLCFIGVALYAGESKVYKNEDLEFSLVYPADWELEEIEIGVFISSLPEFFNFQETGAGIALFISPVGDVNAEQPIQSNEDIWEALKANDETIEEKSVKNIEWLGKQWLVAEFYEKTDDCNAIFYFLIDNGLVYMVSCLYHPPEAQDSYQQIIEEIVSSICFDAFAQ
jgi:hypothetical protein